MKTQIITDVVVDRISLVTNKHTPAVPIATNEYAIFKMFNGLEKTDEEETPINKANVVISKDIEKTLDVLISSLTQTR